MPLKSGELTAKEKLFVAAMLEHGDPKKAEKAAGYLGDMRFQVLARPEIQQEITQRQLARITSEVLPLAVGVHLEILKNSKAPAAARIQAVKLAYDRAFPDTGDGRGKDLHEMTPDELAQLIGNLESIQASTAKDVTPPSDDALG